MITGYAYELWNGKEVVGHFHSLTKIYGRSLVVPETGMFKRSYFRKHPQIEVPIITRVISDNGIDVHYRICLDVRKKSKRQIEILKRSTCPRL